MVKILFTPGTLVPRGPPPRRVRNKIINFILKFLKFSANCGEGSPSPTRQCRGEGLCDNQQGIN